MSAKKLVVEALGPRLTKAVWSHSYEHVLPFSIQRFELAAILPAVFYMFRFGIRRGAGNFIKTYGENVGTPSQRARSVNVRRIAEKLAKIDELEGFEGEAEKAILGDWLLCSCLENIRHAVGQDKQVQRVLPAHYMSSWIDLPTQVVHLRGVPETMVAILADQSKGEYVVRNKVGDKTRFPVGPGYENNVLMRAFLQGVKRRGDFINDKASDRFDEENEMVGLDQLVMIRLARLLSAAPDSVKRAAPSQISNQRPVAERAARNFAEDIRRFVRAYAEPLPRQALVGMLESCMAVGMTGILTSTTGILAHWERHGSIPPRDEQHPAGIFVDCASGVNLRIRTHAENSMDEFVRLQDRLPTVLMMLRLLDYHASINKPIKKENIQRRPYATQWLNELGSLLHGRHRESNGILRKIHDKAEQLAAELEHEYPEVAEILEEIDYPPTDITVIRLAEVLVALMGPSKCRSHLLMLTDSVLCTMRPNGVATKRKTTRGSIRGRAGRRREVRSVILTDSVLDYLVHLHLLPPGNKSGTRRLSFREFVDKIRDRYGFHVDTAPPGATISNEILQRNSATLERRLRDLGLLIGVNDAEAMKRLRPRFAPADTR